MWELAHLQGVFDHWRSVVDAELRLLFAAAYGQYLQVEALRQALVEAQLFIAEEFAATEFGEIKKAEVNRFFDLVGVRAGEDHPGNVGLDKLEPLYRMRIEGRVLQGGDQGLAHRRSFRVGKKQGRKGKTRTEILLFGI